MVIPDILELRQIRLGEHLRLGMLGLEATLPVSVWVCIGILTAHTFVEPAHLAGGAQMRRENPSIRTWNGWFEKKSAAFTRFWVFAYSDIFGTTISLCWLSMTDSFIERILYVVVNLDEASCLDAAVKIQSPVGNALVV
jgi:hypothetical protein